MYFFSILVLRGTFEPSFVFSFDFWWKVVSITFISSLPFVLKFIWELINPPDHMTIGHKKFPISFNKKCCCPSKGKKRKEDNRTSKYVDIDDLDNETSDSLPLLTDDSSLTN